MSDSRTLVLRAVTGAITHLGPPPAPARAYRRTGRLDEEQRTALFCERVGEYRAAVRRLEVSAVPAAVAEICRERGATSLGVPPGLPAAWRPDGIHLVEDRDLTPRELDGLGGALTGCTAAVAETGTLILTAGPREGRRALTLVPDLHICVAGEAQICELLPEALARIEPRRPITLVSGPSATSDIELKRVEGVHGPRNLHVLVVKETP
jgi:L-lactate dehydrogenase complex protein LldG